RPGESAENAEAFPSPESSSAPEAPCPADEGTLDGVPASALVLNGFPFLKAGERPFSQRGRLVVSNVPQGASEDDLRRFFIKFGRLAEACVDSDKREGVVRLETSALAEIARTELDAAEPQGPRVRVRRARHSAALSVGNLSPCVSNELLAEAFGRFGEVERSIVAVEASGSASGGSRASGRGRLEFTSTEEASRAAEACRDGVFLLTACLRPVMVEPFKQLDEEEGVPEASLPRTLHYYKERSKAPRFATPGTLEFEFAARCRALDEMERLHVQQVERGVQRARERLEAEMETAYHAFQITAVCVDRVRRREEMRRLDEERRRHMDAQR
uniref:RRM domain-containing protein n=1 Tax=Petromyzon marinus TaxID=7757 RepID=S4RIP5_PETMA